MTKRNSQANTVVVPVAQAHVANGAVAAPKAVVVPVENDATSAKAEAADKEAPVAVVTEAVAAPVAPVPMAMVQDTTTTTTTTDSSTATTTDTSADGDTDYTPYIVGGVLLAGGILAIALSSGDDNNSTPTPTPTPPATPVTTVTVSSAATATVAENVTTNGATGPVVLDVNAAATATNGGTPGAVTYALSGADAALFTINTTTGEIRLNSSANFEAKSSYAITVTASAAANGTTPAATAAQAITVTITNVNENPTFATATQAVNFAENGTGTVLTATATDVDAGATITYSLSGTDAALFNVSSTGAVTFKAAPDFEATPTKTTFSFNVVATDQGGLTATQAETVTLTNVNEAPAFGAATRTVSIPENTTAVIATGGATDPDAGATITYSLTGADQALFNVNASTGAVTFKAAPDFEAVPTKNTYTFNLVAGDGTNSTSQAVTVNVTDVVNEGPPQVTTSLDTAATVTVSGLGAGGAAQATTFTDNTAVASNATINNFGSDDIVRFTGTTAVSFSSIDNDLTIEFVNAGVLNKIQINDIVSPNAIITSEATAEAAVNAFFGTTGADYFRFA